MGASRARRLKPHVACARAGLPLAAQPMAAAASDLPAIPAITDIPMAGSTAEGPSVSTAITDPATPMAHPAGKPSSLSYSFPHSRRRLQQGPPEDGPPGALPEPAQPFAVEAPLTAPGALLQPVACIRISVPQYLGERRKRQMRSPYGQEEHREHARWRRFLKLQ